MRETMNLSVCYPETPPTELPCYLELLLDSNSSEPKSLEVHYAPDQSRISRELGFECKKTIVHHFGFLPDELTEIREYKGDFRQKDDFTYSQERLIRTHTSPDIPWKREEEAYGLAKKIREELALEMQNPNLKIKQRGRYQLFLQALERIMGK